jgi:hypothetical protein
MSSFLYLGHGTEIIDLVDDTPCPRIKTIPKECTLSTLTKTGLSSKLQQVLRFNEFSIKHPEYLADPVSHFHKIEKFLKGPDGHKYPELKRTIFHLHTEDQPFIEKECDFLFAFFLSRNVRLYKSGLYPVGSTVPQLENKNYQELALAEIDPTGNIPIELIDAMYSESIYPKLKTIKHNIVHLLKKENANVPNSPGSPEGKSITIESEIPYDLFVRAVRLSSKKTVSELMMKYPGNHYFLPCRVYVDQHKMSIHYGSSQTRRLRQMSNNNTRSRFNVSPQELPVEANDYYERLVTECVKKDMNSRNYQAALGVLNMRFIIPEPKPRIIEFFNDLITKIKEHISLGYFTINDVTIAAELRALKKKGVISLD